MNEKGNLFLPEKFRAEMRKPLGPIIGDSEADGFMKRDEGKILITVGDRTTQRLLSAGILPRLAAIDLQVGRKKVKWEKTMFDRFTNEAAVHKLVSGPGYVSRGACDIVKQWAENGFPKTVLVIDGEEDLLVLPILTQTPVRSVLYYGQPKVGLVRVVVDEQVKKKAVDFLKHFER
jgi:uncharacterized protein (UPF0218 family)